MPFPIDPSPSTLWTLTNGEKFASCEIAFVPIGVKATVMRNGKLLYATTFRRSSAYALRSRWWSANHSALTGVSSSVGAFSIWRPTKAIPITVATITAIHARSITPMRATTAPPQIRIRVHVDA